MISAGPFTFMKGNRNIKIREVLMAEKDLLLERRSWPDMIQRQTLLASECDVSEIPKRVWCK